MLLYQSDKAHRFEIVKSTVKNKSQDYENPGFLKDIETVLSINEESDYK